MIHLDRGELQTYVVRRATRDGRRVVEKSVRDPRDGRATSLLLRERDLLCRLAVPGIARVVAYEPPADSTEPQGARLILEDAGPEDLAALLTRGPLGPSRFLDLAIEMTEILAHVHKRNVLHTRLSPSSFVLAPVPAGEQVTLVGFDAAADAGASPSLQHGAISAYVAPELTGRLARRADQRADLYALGAIFYEMLVGRPPFTQDDPVELIHAHLAKVPFAPATLDANIPRALSDITLKLLAKRPEDRYQGAEALRLDLEAARQQWRATKAIAPFELGRDDLVRELALPTLLYGREEALAAVSSAVDRLDESVPDILVITGPPGVGKSALAEVLAASARKRGRFLYAKCDVLAKNRPYASLLEVFGKLVDEWSEAPDPERAALRAHVLEATASTARILVDFDPRLERLVGETPEVPILDEPEAESRLHAVLQSFIRAISTEQPLTLFLDDAQWADDATLKFVRALTIDPEQRSMLLGLAYRNDEVGVGHAAYQTLEAAQRAGVAVQYVELGPLDIAAVTAFLAETLKTTPDAVRPLGIELHRKTAGNPLFLRRVLHALHRRDLLVYDARAGKWCWDVGRIAATPLADDVVDLLLGTIGQLSHETQDTLATAACFGTHFDLERVAEVTGKSVADEARALWPAIDEGLVVALATERTARHDGNAYAFAHDRIQQAAYNHRSLPDRQRTHLRIGRALLANATPSMEFAVADQLNLASALLTRPADRIELAELNLRTGERAAAHSAHGPALAYLTHGLALLPDDAWSQHHALAFGLHRAAATSASMEGEIDRTCALISVGLAQTASRDERAQLYAISIMGMTVGGLYADAVRCLGEALPAFDIERPNDDLASAAAREMTSATEAIMTRGNELLAAPMMAAQDLLVLRLLVSALPAAFYVEPRLQLWLAARIVNLTFAQGPAPPACFAVTMLSLGLAGSRQLPAADEVGLFAIRLAEHLGDPAAAIRASFLHASIVKPWIAPIRACIPLLQKPVEDLLRLGEHQHAPWYVELLSALQFEQGIELDTVLATVEVGARLTRKLGHSLSGSYFEIFGSDIRRLTGGDGAHAAHLERASTVYVGVHHIVQMQTSYILGDLATAASETRLAQEFVPYLGGLPVSWPDYNLFGALIEAARCKTEGPDEKRRAVAKIRPHRDLFDDWSRLCPENFRHLVSLIDAEIAVLEDRRLDACRLYEESIEAAERNAFVQHAAIANERCGRLHLDLGNRRAAETFLASALRGYARWGATVKVQALSREFPRLRTDVRAVSSTADVDIDVIALLTAAEALASEVDLARLIDKLMRTCLATAGAERGLLVLENDRQACVRALATDAGVSLEQTPIASYRDIPHTIVDDIRRTGRTIVLDDARRSAYADDPDVVARGVRSVLAMPLRRAERETGVLYLENNLLQDAFHAERVRALDLLSGHLSVAIENGLLFEARTNAEAALRFLADASATLAESLDYKTTLARVAHLVVPTLADMCAVDVDDNGRIQRVAVAHVDPTKEALLASAGASVLDLSSAHPVAQVLRTARPCVLDDLDEETTRAVCRDAGEFFAVRSLDVRSVIVVPLLARGRTLGTISLVGMRPGSLSRHDLTLVEDLGRRAGLAIDNARLYDETLGTIRKRDEFLALASHELKTPLTSLQLAIQPLANEDLQISREQVARAASIASRQVVRLGRLVGELLDVSRLRFGKIELVLDDVDLADVAKAAAERLDQDVRRASCKLELHTVSVIGRWDRSPLDRVVTNLLANAIKFGAGGIIELHVEGDEKRARLVVSDHGIGIPLDRIEGLFERFERAVSARHYGGLGLGLYISRSIVEGLGGTVRAESEGPGRGATFTMELPRWPRVAGPLTDPSRPQ